MKMVFARLMPVAASVAIHVALVGGIALLPAWTAPQESVVVLELVEPEQPPAPAAPPPPKPDRRPLIPPKPIAAPMPAPPRIEKPIEKPIEPPPAPRVEPPAPEPVKPAAVAPPTPVTPPPVAAPAAPPAPAAAPPAPSPAATMPGRSSSTSTTFTISDGPPAREPVAPSGPAVAALPSDGVTQGAVPRPGYHPQPPYPRSARDKRIEGTTLLRVFVAANGRVGEVIVRESAGDPELDEAAASTIRRWLFEPARRGREAVAVWVELPVVFTIKR